MYRSLLALNCMVSPWIQVLQWLDRRFCSEWAPTYLAGSSWGHNTPVRLSCLICKPGVTASTYWVPPFPGAVLSAFQALTHHFPQPYTIWVINISICQMEKLKHRGQKDRHGDQSQCSSILPTHLSWCLTGRIKYTLLIKIYFLFIRNFYLLFYVKIKVFLYLQTHPIWGLSIKAYRISIIPFFI